ncbi:MAG: hypothetical protein DMG28_10085 [Acidobacteria bacterium]|nr:MAG: hypothetical protein DMG28_10085 [Acidobacteriota bacterium]
MTTTVFTKYRGKKEFLLVYSELINGARRRGTLTYQEVAELMGLPPRGSHMGVEAGHLLGEISEDEHLNGRPMLSAIAVSTSGMPGSGFFELARRLGKITDTSADAQRRFWEKEKEAVYATWQKDFKE